MREVALAWRRLMAAPVFTAFAVISLALGLGVTTAVYSAIDTLLWRPAGLADADRVLCIFAPTLSSGRPTCSAVVSRADYDEVQRSQQSFTSVAAWTLIAQTMADEMRSELIRGEAVTGSYFTTVGVEAALGRTLQPGDDDVRAPAVILLSHQLWRIRFHGDPTVIGRTVRVGGHPFEIVGVAADSFGGLSGLGPVTAAAWIPMASLGLTTGGSSFGGAGGVGSIAATAGSDTRDQRTLSVIGRLAPGRDLADASAELAVIARRLDESTPLRGRGGTPAGDFVFPRSWSAQLVERANARYGEVVSPIGATIVGLVALVLVVACTNLANLIQARGTSRRHELAVRRALGATRWQLVRQESLEAVIIALAGAAGAAVVTRVLMTMATTDVPFSESMIVHFEPRLSLPVLGASAAALLLSLLVFGIWPAWQLTGTNLRADLASEAGSIGAPRWRTRRSLISWQVTISAAFFLVALLCIKQIAAAARHDPGIDVSRLAIASTALQSQPRRADDVRRSADAVVQAARAQPAIDVVVVVSGLPFGLTSVTARSVPITKPGEIIRPGESPKAWTHVVAATPGVFSALGVPILRGQAFDERDSRTSELVVVLSERIARTVFGSDNVIGQQVTLLAEIERGPNQPPDGPRRIIGIARDTDTSRVGQRSGGVVYVPFVQYDPIGVVFVARAAGDDPREALAALQTAIHRADPDLPIVTAGTGPLLLAPQYLVVRVAAGLAAGLGVLALVLAMAGLYGVLSHLVSRRTREMGVRLALGATPQRIERMVLFDGLRPVLDGLALGLAAGIAGRLAMRPLFTEPIAVIDPLAFSLLPVPLLVAAALACYLPARRAGRVPPNQALHEL